MRHRLACAGAVVALTAGLAGGVALKAELARAIGGRQPQAVFAAIPPAPDAFEAWYPGEGAPPPWVEDVHIPANVDGTGSDVLDDEAILTAAGLIEDPPEPYLPPPPAADPPEWGWALPDGAAPDPALQESSVAAAG